MSSNDQSGGGTEYSRTVPVIKGVQYTKPQTEYQVFPESYFSGADLTMYFEDIWVDDLTAIEFNLQESLVPVYGYNAYTWDTVARGTRLIEGHFRIAFREVGYLHAVMQHIGQGEGKAKPYIAYLMTGEEPPDWLAGVKERLEDQIDRTEDYEEDFEESETKDLEPRYLYETKTKITYTDERKWEPALRYGQTSSNVNEYQDLIVSKKHKDLRITSSKSAIRKYPTLRYGSGYRSDGRTTFNLQHLKPQVREVQKRLNHYVYNLRLLGGSSKATTYTVKKDDILGYIAIAHGVSLSSLIAANPQIENPDLIYPNQKINIPSKGSSALVIDGYFGPLTRASCRAFQKYAEIKVDGICGPKTLELLSYGMSATSYFGVTTKYATMRFQMAKKLTVDGIVGPKTQAALGLAVRKRHEEKVKVPTEQIVIPRPTRPKPSQTEFARYKADIWGSAFQDERPKDFNTYFHSTKSQDWMKLEGFDIYITYGPFPEAIQHNDDQLPDRLNFETTIKVLRNVQIRSIGQSLNANGEPIEEVYQFIARDLD